jgi:hypothetical protein
MWVGCVIRRGPDVYVWTERRMLSMCIPNQITAAAMSRAIDADGSPLVRGAGDPSGHTHRTKMASRFYEILGFELVAEMKLRRSPG